MLLSIQDFFAHFHPVLVHLPIGILLIAVLFQFLSAKEKYKSLQPAIGLALFLGMISAVASCISGFLLSQSGDYDSGLVSKHQWLGIATAVVSILAYYLVKKNNQQIKWIMGLIALLIIVTGHLGGSLTHGSDYLTEAFSTEGAAKEIKRKPIANIQEAAVYNDLVQPVLEARCYSCHGTNKQKGKLRLDNQEFILKGGKDGKIIVSGKADESEFIKRLFLPKDNKDHMPPKEKPQLGKEDMELLHWWVSSGADFNKKVKELELTEKVKPFLAALQSGGKKAEAKLADIPAEAISKANDADIQKLNQAGVTIVPVAENSNYLAASFVAVDTLTAQTLSLLEPIKKQLIWLKLGDTKITDANLAAVSKLSSLTRLYLEHTAITDNGMAQLKNLLQLQYINLIGTKVTAKGLQELAALKNLQQVFTYQSGIKANDFENLKKIFPKTTIDTGGYVVPFLTTDTTEAKAPVQK